ncbi:hypothetical protein BD779DRAFT_1548252 [Infundibulicybe gibba]|nr:hypothetical protein BD779DRAFT_1548252 [Infundibulicybe gibba]
MAHGPFESESSYTMSQHLPVESICAVLTCTSAEFLSKYDDNNFSTHVLCEDAHNIVERNRERLRAAHHRYRLDDLLSAMLKHAPQECGKRYVAVALHIARDKGGTTVVNVARSWMEHLFLPVSTLAVTGTRWDEDWTPTPLDPGSLREKVAIREQYKCAITGMVDRIYAEKLRGQGLRAPAGFRRSMSVAHIIPPSLSELIENSAETHVTHMSNMLFCWTGLDMKLLGSHVNAPENAVLMTLDEQLSFERLHIYFDKAAYPTAPNKYTVQMATNLVELSNERTSAEVEFHARDGIQPPNPEYLAVHAAFAKVVNICGAAAYVEDIEDLRNAELDGENLCQDKPTDFISGVSMSRLS